jgi:acyl-CoA thioester hydrolase
MKPPVIPLENIRLLDPPCLRMRVPAAYADANGHMNMRWYVAIFDDAGDELHARLGIHEGTVDLEHHTWFVSEVLPGDEISVYARLVAHSPKRVHYLMFLVNETRSRLAAVFECMNACLDRHLRKTVPFPPEIAARVAALEAAHESLDWRPPVCGAIEA